MAEDGGYAGLNYGHAGALTYIPRGISAAKDARLHSTRFSGEGTYEMSKSRNHIH